MLALRKPYRPAIVEPSTRVHVGATIDTTPAPSTQFSASTFLVGAFVGVAGTLIVQVLR